VTIQEVLDEIEKQKRTYRQSMANKSADEQEYFRCSCDALLRIENWITEQLRVEKLLESLP